MASGPTICVVGGGKFGEVHLKALRQLDGEGRCRLAGLAEPDSARRDERARQFGVRAYADLGEMLRSERPDAVTVATPDHLHREAVLAALAAGAHVLVEKPLDVTVEGCRAMIQAARQADRLLQVDFHKRYDHYHAELWRQARAGKFGRIEYGYAWIEDRLEVPRDWLRAWAGRSSPAWFLGVHMVDLFLWIAQARGRRVWATGVREKLPAIGIDGWDSVGMMVQMQDGSHLQCQCSWILPDGFEAIVNQGIRLVGTEGVMEVDSQDRGARSCFAADGRMATYNQGFYSERPAPGGGVEYAGYGIDAIADFVGHVARRMGGARLEDLKGFYPDGEAGLEATKVIAAAHESLESGRMVEIE